MSKILTSGSFLITVAMLVPAAATAQPDFESVEIQVQQVKENIYMLTGAGGNIGVCVGEDGVIMIDDQYAELSEKIRTAINGISEEPIRFVLNTHWHGDHVGGNESFAGTGSTIIAQKNVRERMSTGQIIQALDMTMPPSPDEALPVITFEDDLMLHLNGEDILMMHYHEAHTDGDALVFFMNSNVIHMGDTYLSGMYPFIDVSTGGGIDGAIRWINHVLFLIDDETQVIPGHGQLSNRAEMVAYRNMLQTVRDLVYEGIESGLSLDEIRTSKPTADLDDTWSGPFINGDMFVEIVYASLIKDRD
jgi:cyclase